MEHALKLALVDPRHVEFRELNKSATDQSRVDSSLEMKRILASSTEAADVKLKRYTQTLNRFLNAGNSINDQPPPPINWAPQLQSATKAVKRVKSKKAQPHVNVRRSSRPRKLTYKWMRY